MENTGINYTGEVTIKYKAKDTILQVKKYNHAEQNLFEVLCKALAGYSVTQDIPAYLDIRAAETDTDIYSSCLQDYSPISGITYTYINDTWKTNYNAEVSFTDIIATDADYYRLYLISKTNNDLAYLTLSKEDFKKIVPGIQLLLTWSMYFTNIQN